MEAQLLQDTNTFLAAELEKSMNEATALQKALAELQKAYAAKTSVIVHGNGQTIVSLWKHTRKLSRELREVKLVWSKEMPKVPGNYWYRDLESRHDKEPVVHCVRDFCGKLAIVNCHLDAKVWKGEWAGPIALPKKRRAKPCRRSIRSKSSDIILKREAAFGQFMIPSMKNMKLPLGVIAITLGWSLIGKGIKLTNQKACIG